MERVVIIGNGGSGKTWLSRQLGTILNSRIYHLDRFFWEAGGSGKKRPKAIYEAFAGIKFKFTDRSMMQTFLSSCR
jgi:adenylate kinase family enzyme